MKYEEEVNFAVISELFICINWAFRPLFEERHNEINLHGPNHKWILEIANEFREEILMLRKLQALLICALLAAGKR